jgi:hypothetical protein
VVFPADLKLRHKLSAMQQMKICVVAPLVVASAFVRINSPGVTIAEMCYKICIRETVGSGGQLAHTDAWMHKTRGSRIVACSWLIRCEASGRAIPFRVTCEPRVSQPPRQAYVTTPSSWRISITHWSHPYRITTHNRFALEAWCAMQRLVIRSPQVGTSCAGWLT